MRYIVLAILFVCNTALADVTVIYRVSDKKVVGMVFPPQSVDVEIDNITKSELGGTKDDYDTATIKKIPSGHVVEIDLDRKVKTKMNPKATAKKAAKKRAHNKLKALGLTQEEIESLR